MRAAEGLVMLGFARVYLYWSVLWGFLAHPAVGLKGVLPGLLMAADLSVMVVCALYLAGSAWRRVPVAEQPPLRAFAAAAAGVLVWGLLMTVVKGGNAVEAGKYLGGLLRAMLLLASLFVLSRQPGSAAALAPAWRLVRGDLMLLSGVQMGVAALQAFVPSVGQHFIVSLTDTHSALWAFEDGDVSGTFANSIDLAYLLLATYVCLGLMARLQGRTLTVLWTAPLGYFTWATGSDAATVLFVLAAVHLHSVRWPAPYRRLAFALVAMLAMALIARSFQTFSSAVVEKVDNMMLSRLGLIFVSLPGMAEFRPLDLLTGLGADSNFIFEALRSLPDVPLVFTYDEAAPVLNDVFWVALLLSLGGPAMAWLLWRWAGALRAYITPSRAGATPWPLADAPRLLLGLIVLAGFINQILLVRSFNAALLLGLYPLALAATAAAGVSSPASATQAGGETARPSGPPPALTP